MAICNCLWNRLNKFYIHLLNWKMKYSPELFIWIAALLYVALIPPTGDSICMFHFWGIEWCPGCGLGHSIYLLLHGKLMLSLKAHWFGIPAVLILVHRIYILSRLNIKPPKKYESTITLIYPGNNT
jgi:hypothetical protein